MESNASGETKSAHKWSLQAYCDTMKAVCYPSRVTVQRQSCMQHIIYQITVCSYWNTHLITRIAKELVNFKKKANIKKITLYFVVNFCVW